MKRKSHSNFLNGHFQNGREHPSVFLCIFKQSSKTKIIVTTNEKYQGALTCSVAKRVVFASAKNIL